MEQVNVESGNSGGAVIRDYRLDRSYAVSLLLSSFLAAHRLDFAAERLVTRADLQETSGRDSRRSSFCAGAVMNR